MMKIAVILLSMMFFGVAPTLSIAGINTFECKVTSFHEISKEGEIITNTKHSKEQVGSTFSVERNTGVIRGGYFINNRASKSIEVINESEDDAYYVISRSYGPVSYVGYLFIGNYHKSIKKPFTFTNSGKYVYTGYCI